VRTVRHRGTGGRGAVRAFLPSPAVFLAMAGLVAVVAGGPTQAAPCLNLLTAAAAPAEGYGAAFDTVGATAALLVAGSQCGGGAAKVAIGSGSADEYVFKTAYYRDGEAWRELPLEGGPLVGGAWYKGTAFGSMPLGPGPRAVLGYVCQRRGEAWKCGCSDVPCREQRWQMQLISAPAEGPAPELIPFAQPPLSTLQASDRLVVAHWHQFPISREKVGAEADSYAGALERDDGAMSIRLRPLGRPARSDPDWALADAFVDIRWAQAIGVDAFLLNVATDMRNPWAWPAYTRFLKAAAQLGTGFKIAPNIDCVSPGGGRAMAETILARLGQASQLASPSQLRVNGKFVVGSFYANNCGVPYWSEFKAAMKAGGLDPFLVCVMLGGAYRAEYDPVCDAWSDWGRRDPWSAASSDYAGRYAGARGEPIMAAISHGDIRYGRGGNIAYEQRGSQTLRINWEEAIGTGADWAQLNTWNDIGEHAAFYPNTAQQFAVYDLSAYYIAWFKTGAPPPIVRDGLYYFHRIARVPPAPQLRFGSWLNEVEAVAFLTAPATVEIVTDAGTARGDFPAGVHVLTAPLPATGRPRFRIVRNGATVAEVTSAFAVGPMPDRNDVVYRSGGSLRADTRAAAAEQVCRGGDPDACLMHPSEPVWLAR
jgi:hypothetical protein